MEEIRVDMWELNEKERALYAKHDELNKIKGSQLFYF